MFVSAYDSLNDVVFANNFNNPKPIVIFVNDICIDVQTRLVIREVFNQLVITDKICGVWLCAGVDKERCRNEAECCPSLVVLALFSHKTLPESLTPVENKTHCR